MPPTPIGLRPLTGPYHVEQHAEWALGNFINITPAIRWLAEKRGERVPVFFATRYTRECFLDCPFMQLIDRPIGERLFGSELVCGENYRRDLEHSFELVTGERWNAGWHTYVDPCPAARPLDLPPRYIVVINGSGSLAKQYVSTKDPGARTYARAIERSPLPVIYVGSEGDLGRSPWARGLQHYTGDIRTALAVIDGAALVIANDTGLAHAAGALDKRSIVLWKSTPRPRCENAGRWMTYPMPDAWDSTIADALDRLRERMS